MDKSGKSFAVSVFDIYQIIFAPVFVFDINHNDVALIFSGKKEFDAEFRRFYCVV